MHTLYLATSLSQNIHVFSSRQKDTGRGVAALNDAFRYLCHCNHLIATYIREPGASTSDTSLLQGVLAAESTVICLSSRGTIM